MALGGQQSYLLHALKSSVMVHSSIDTKAGMSIMYKILLCDRRKGVERAWHRVQSQTLFILELGIFVILAGLSKQHV